MSALVVESIGPLATIQDGGRAGFAHLGVPRSGAWDEDARVHALAAVGGALDDAIIELPLLGAIFRCEGSVTASIDGAPARTFEDGERIEISRADRAVRVLAVRGRIDVPRVLGSRSTLVVARLGGFNGRPLVRGDVVPIAASSGAVLARASDRNDALPIPSTLDAIATHGADPGLLQRLASTELRVSARSDRVGTRFDCESIGGAPPAKGVSRPMVRGAIELPPDGLPIAIGPDGPTTGGYAIVAVLTRASCSALARVRPGGRLALRITSFEDAERGKVPR